MTNTPTSSRMAPDARRAQILQAARRVLVRDGIDRFSLEQVAREADVALTLPRHYFQSTDGLLAAALIDAIYEITDVLTAPAPNSSLEDRWRAYIANLANDKWGHELWLRSAYIDHDVNTVVQDIRRRMIEGSFQRHWDDMTPREQLAYSGWVGYVEAAVAEWIKQGAQDQQLLLDVMLDGAKRLGVRGL
jgi:AcrR family transcriptional regulator